MQWNEQLSCMHADNTSTRNNQLHHFAIIEYDADGEVACKMARWLVRPWMYTNIRRREITNIFETVPLIANPISNYESWKFLACAWNRVFLPEGLETNILPTQLSNFLLEGAEERLQV